MLANCDHMSALEEHCSNWTRGTGADMTKHSISVRLDTGEEAEGTQGLETAASRRTATGHPCRAQQTTLRLIRRALNFGGRWHAQISLRADGCGFFSTASGPV